MTDTKSPAELLGLYERLCEATGVDIYDSGNNNGSLMLSDKFSSIPYFAQDCDATDILEARIWRVLREWAGSLDLEADMDVDGLVTIYSHGDYANGGAVWVCGGSPLHEAAEAVIEHIRKDTNGN